MPTELRAALRDIAENLTDATLDADPEADAGNHEEAHEYLHLAIGPAVKRLRAIADAPPTVAELLPRVDATHEVRWQCSIEAKAECRAVYADGNIAIQWRHPGGRWRSQEMTAADLIQPARLVEVTP